MADISKGWQRDPFGVHEFRFFSDDGKATRLVSDGGTTSFDPPPDIQTGIVPRRIVATSVETTEPGLSEARGWQLDPFGVHELRFFSDEGVATRLVSDGGTKSYDDLPVRAMRIVASIRRMPESPSRSPHAGAVSLAPAVRPPVDVTSRPGRTRKERWIGEGTSRWARIGVAVALVVSVMAVLPVKLLSYAPPQHAEPLRMQAAGSASTPVTRMCAPSPR
jgi:hypothetical protein